MYLTMFQDNLKRELIIQLPNFLSPDRVLKTNQPQWLPSGVHAEPRPWSASYSIMRAPSKITCTEIPPGQCILNLKMNWPELYLTGSCS